MVVLNAVETRVVGSLIEKEITTPEYYPLSLNALVNACNQKSSRDPVMELSEADVRSALFDLEQRALVRVLADARVPKFEHRLRDPLQLRRDEIAVVCLLLLRGPQTGAELRARADRLYSFEDSAAVTATLERLAAREDPVTRHAAATRGPGDAMAAPAGRRDRCKRGRGRAGRGGAAADRRREWGTAYGGSRGPGRGAGRAARAARRAAGRFREQLDSRCARVFPGRAARG